MGGIWLIYEIMKPASSLIHPSMWLPESAIQYDQTSDQVKIDLSSLNIQFSQPPIITLGTYADTHSMSPVIEAGYTGIAVQGASPADQKLLLDHLSPGDIATYYNTEVKTWIIHRIIRICQTPMGRIWVFKGDNNDSDDGVLIYDSNIQSVLVGIIY